MEEARIIQLTHQYLIKGLVAHTDPVFCLQSYPVNLYDDRRGHDFVLGKTLDDACVRIQRNMKCSGSPPLSEEITVKSRLKWRITTPAILTNLYT